jgi:hypothetical protein
VNEDVRVFSVVDEAHDPSRQAAAFGGKRELELRLGPWSVSVRLTEEA